MGGAETPGAVELSFTYTEDEYIRAARLFFSRGTEPQLRRYLGLGFFACALLFAWLAGDMYVAAAVLLPGLLVLARYWYAYAVLPRSYFRDNPKFRERYELTFSDEGLLFRSKGVESRLGWDFYTEVLETPDYFFLVYGKDMFSLIPKRVLRGPRQESALREMLRRNLGRGAEAAGLPAAGSRDIEREYVPPAEPPDWR
jgi:hypothetical protein